MWKFVIFAYCPNLEREILILSLPTLLLGGRSRHYQNWTGGEKGRGFSYDLNSARAENGEIGDWDG